MQRHYLAVVEQDHFDKAGNKRGTHLVKKSRAKGEQEDDDWLQCAGYAEMAAILRGIDQHITVAVDAAKAAADEEGERRDANRDQRRARRVARNRQRRNRQRRDRRR